MPVAREGLCSLWKERWEMKANTHSSPAVMDLLVNRTASGIPFAKHSLGQAPFLAPIPSLSQNFLSPYSFLYAQYMLYDMERHLQHCNNHVMLCTEIWGEAHLCSTMLVFVCICVCIVNKKNCMIVFFELVDSKEMFPLPCSLCQEHWEGCFTLLFVVGIFSARGTLAIQGLHYFHVDSGENLVFSFLQNRAIAEKPSAGNTSPHLL